MSVILKLTRIVQAAAEAPVAPGAVGEQVPAHVWKQALGAPLESVLSRPGKEFRARLLTTSYLLAGGAPPIAAEIPALLEILHAGSLVVDDIEDDSESRRGAPSLHVAYGTPVKALEDVDLQLHSGEVLALMGENGAGKSTLMNYFLGQKIAITSAKPQTTRNRILGIVDQAQAQVASG